MFICCYCQESVTFPILLDCQHMVCTVCMYEFKTKYPFNNALLHCKVCSRPVFLNGRHTVVIDREKYLIDTKVPDKDF